MIRILNHPSAGSNVWEATVFHDLEEMASIDKELLKSSEFGVMIGTVFDDPLVALRPLKSCRLSVTSWGEFPSEFDHMKLIEKWFKAAKINHLGWFFLQISKEPQGNVGFPVTYAVTQEGKVFEDSYAIGCPFPHAWE